MTRDFRFRSICWRSRRELPSSRPTGVAVLRPLREHLQDHGGRGLRELQVQLARVRHPLLEVLAHDDVRGRTRERRAAGDHVVERGPQAVDVRAEVGLVTTADLLRGHVGRGADGSAVPRGLRRLHERGLGQPHVAELHDPVGGDHQVLRLDVPVDEVVLGGVPERVHGLERDGEGALLVEDDLLLQDFEERIALHVLHHEVVVAVRLAVVEAPDDVLVVQGDGDPRLPEEALQVVLGRGPLLREDLDRDDPLERLLVRLVDDARSALAELLQDLVLPDFHPGELSADQPGLVGRQVALLDEDLLDLPVDPDLSHRLLNPEALVDLGSSDQLPLDRRVDESLRSLVHFVQTDPHRPHRGGGSPFYMIANGLRIVVRGPER